MCNFQVFQLTPKKFNHPSEGISALSSREMVICGKRPNVNAPPSPPANGESILFFIVSLRRSRGSVFTLLWKNLLKFPSLSMQIPAWLWRGYKLSESNGILLTFLNILMMSNTCMVEFKGSMEKGNITYIINSFKTFLDDNVYMCWSFFEQAYANPIVNKCVRFMLSITCYPFFFVLNNWTIDTCNILYFKVFFKVGWRNVVRRKKLCKFYDARGIHFSVCDSPSTFILIIQVFGYITHILVHSTSYNKIIMIFDFFNENKTKQYHFVENCILVPQFRKYIKRTCFVSYFKNI